MSTTAITHEAVARLLALLRTAVDETHMLTGNQDWRAAFDLALEVSEAHRGQPDDAAVAAITDRLNGYLNPLARFAHLLDTLSAHVPALSDERNRKALFTYNDGPTLLMALLGALQSEIASLSDERLPLLRRLADRCNERGEDCYELGLVTEEGQIKSTSYYLMVNTSREIGYGAPHNRRTSWFIEITRREMDELCPILLGISYHPAAIEEREAEALDLADAEVAIVAIKEFFIID